MNTKRFEHLCEKIANATGAFLMGLATLPAAVVLWPIGCAVFAWRETDRGEYGKETR